MPHIGSQLDSPPCSDTPLLQKIVEFSHPYREARSSDSESESSSDDESIGSVPVINIADELDEEVDSKLVTGLQANNKMFEDLGLLDLPPLEELTISVPEEECIPIGTVSNIIDLLVLVSAKRGTPAVNLDSVLFLEHGKKTLGRVFDVFGQVNEPLYMVRFNSAEHIKEQGIEIGMDVYFAPRTPHTAYVFIDALIKMKGSDASWEHDMEPPEGCIDYSDDEEERRAKAARRMKKGVRGKEDGVPFPHKKKQRFPPHAAGGSGHLPPNPFYMNQQNQQYYAPPPNTWNQGPPWGVAPSYPPPPYAYPPFGGTPQYPPQP